MWWPLKKKPKEPRLPPRWGGEAFIERIEQNDGKVYFMIWRSPLGGPPFGPGEMHRNSLVSRDGEHKFATQEEAEAAADAWWDREWSQRTKWRGIIEANKSTRPA